MSEQTTSTPPDESGTVLDVTSFLTVWGLQSADEKNRREAVRALRGARARVEGYLGRVILPSTFTVEHITPSVHAWTFEPADLPVHSITDAVAETYPDGAPTGLYTVTYTAGLDVREDPEYAPIRDFLDQHAANSPAFVAHWAQTTNTKGTIRSSSTEGQSVTYNAPTLGGGGAPGSGAPGSLPTLASLERWKRRDAFQRRGSAPGWPYGGVW